MFREETVAEGRYRIQQLLKKGPQSQVYSALAGRTGRRVILKVFSADPHSRSDIIRFHTEQEILSEITHPSVVRIHGHGSFEGPEGAVQYVAMEYVEGRTLEEAMADGEPFTVEEIVRGALGLCGALEAVHGRGLIHGDLKPENIIISRDAGAPPSVTLIDFGSARLKDFDRHGPDGHIDGTFACMSPEQCGLIHAPVDEAGDLYALGVLLYRMLTGSYPYGGGSLSALLHEKISKAPEPPSRRNPDVPPVLDAIILRLLEKEPESRYREISGLLYDLERILRGERNFPPGEQDFGRVSFKAPLIGREREIAVLDEMYGEVSRGRTCCCLVTGEAGAGKTRLLREYRTSLMERGVLVLEGRALEMENREAWSLFSGTMKEYLKVFQRYDDEKKSRVASVIRGECADFGAVVTGLAPGMELVLGKCAPLAPLEPDRESQRFLLSLVRFLRSLVAAEGEIAVFLDDLHWADEGSIRLIEETMKTLSGRRVFLLASMRGEERSSRPVLDMAARLRDGGTVTVRHLTLNPLTPGDISRYLGAVLRGGGEDTERLAGHIYSRTGGNPLFTEELARHLFRRGVLIRDQGRWRIDARGLDTADLPESVLDTIGLRIGSLSGDDREVLSHAAAIGRSFRVDILMDVLPGGEKGLDRVKKAVTAMANAARECVVMEDVAERGMVVFTHERIREACLRRMGAAARRKLHGRIVTALERRLENGGASVFDLAHHAGESGDREKTALYAGAAGERAMESYAYADAIAYLGVALKALEDGAGGPPEGEKRAAWTRLMEKYGESLVFVGRCDEGIEVFERLLQENIDEKTKVSIYLQMTKASFRKGDFHSCESYARDGLKICGEKLPSTKGKVLLYSIFEFVKAVLFKRVHHGFINKRTIENKKISINYYHWLFFTAFFHKGWKGLYYIARMLNIAVSYLGKSPELALTYYNLGFICVSLGLIKQAKKYLDESYSIYHFFNDQYGMGRALNGLGYYSFATADFKNNIITCRESISLLKTIGDFNEIIKASQFLFTNYSVLGDYKNARIEYDTYLPYLTNVFDEIIYSAFEYPASYLIHSHKFNEAEKLILKYMKIEFDMEAWFAYTTSLSNYGKLFYEMEDYGKAASYFKEGMQLVAKYGIPRHYLNILYPYYTLCLIKLYQRNNLKMLNGWFYRFKIKLYLKKSLRMTRIWKHHYDLSLYCAALYFNLVDNKKKAIKFFNESLSFSINTGKRYQEARTRYEYGLWLMEQKEHDRAWTQLDRAYLIFKDIGIAPYQKKILELMRSDGERRDPLRRYLDRERKERAAACVEEINRCGGYGELLATALDRAMEICGARSGGIFIADTETGVPRLERHRAVDGGEFEYSRHIVEKCFAERKAVITTSAEESEEFSIYRSVSAAGLKSILCLPLRHNELMAGACYLDNNLASGVFRPDDARLLELFLSSAAVLIENFLLAEKLRSAGAAPPPEETVSAEQHVVRALAFIEKNFARELTREEIARATGVSPDYLGKVFKSRTGKSIHDHLNETRVRWALGQLTNTDRKIIDIAFDAGFDSLRTFNRAFAKIMGGPPAKYRRK